MLLFEMKHTQTLSRLEARERSCLLMRDDVMTLITLLAISSRQIGLFSASYHRARHIDV